MKKTKKTDKKLKKIENTWKNWKMKERIWVILRTHMTSCEKSLGQGPLKGEWCYELSIFSKSIFIFFSFYFLLFKGYVRTYYQIGNSNSIEKHKKKIICTNRHFV